MRGERLAEHCVNIFNRLILNQGISSGLLAVPFSLKNWTTQFFRLNHYLKLHTTCSIWQALLPVSAFI